jgi:putative ABC transport system ATP-binding protein
MPIIELYELSKLYGFGDAATVALDEINLSVEPGEFVAIMGPSGCGKSTLLNMIGLLDRPTYGSYQLSGRSVARLRANRQARIRRDRIGFVFQSLNLLPSLTALENVALPLAYKGVSVVRRLRQASQMLDRVGMKQREYYLPTQLSGGQSQSVAIARALINEPSIIIADEPTGNLDSSASVLIMELLSEIHKNGTTILLVTHNPELTRYASRVVYMRDGSIVHDEPTQPGQVAPTARKNWYYMPFKNEEDDLAGVSALMKHIPGVTAARKRAASKKRRAPKRTKAKPQAAKQKGRS